MGSNNGTGVPLTMGCSKCRSNYGRRHIYTRPDGTSDFSSHLGRPVRTGRVKKKDTGGGSRMMQEAHEYRCLDCGHVGWSAHKGVTMRPLETK